MTTTIETPKQIRLWTCPACGRKAHMLLDSPLPIRCACGFIDRDYSHTVIVDNASTRFATQRAEQKPVVKECPHRSTEFRLVDCPSCRGKIELKVFRCDLHGECTIAKKLPGVHVCGT